MKNRPQRKSLWSDDYKKKIVPPDEWHDFRDSLRREKRRLATLNGSFDLLHAGHLQILYEASQQADVLWVALNSDSSIQQNKGVNRPIIPLTYRLQLLAMLACVDAITWFDEVDPRRFLTIAQPDVHVNGAEYGLNCIEAETVKAYGGELYLVERVDDLSTSAILKKIQDQVSGL